MTAYINNSNSDYTIKGYGLIKQGESVDIPSTDASASEAVLALGFTKGSKASKAKTSNAGKGEK
tara:strand:- start:448 stop:639 length:192 start_codon:yes stop_codon:yes gene_type:complete